MGNCHYEKTNVDRGEVEVYIGFRGVTNFVQSIKYYIIPNVYIIEYIVYITFGFKTILVR